MQLTVILADYANATDGHLTVHGGGKTVYRPRLEPHYLGLIVEVEADETDHRHHLEAQLHDRAGRPVLGLTGDPIGVVLDFFVSRPFHHHADVPLSRGFAANIGAIPLTPSSRYEWVVSINGLTRRAWRKAFSVRDRVLQHAS